ncbi:MAG: hypothetical protein JNM27_18430 [Leptospirales bacterium]|nr:hypothetical protein [Leptospirales bacterium]
MFKQMILGQSVYVTHDGILEPGISHNYVKLCEVGAPFLLWLLAMTRKSDYRILSDQVFKAEILPGFQD